MNKSRNYFLFIKIGKEEHIDALQKKGHLYCNTIRSYRKMESETLRGDKHEGKAYMKQVKSLQLLIDNKVIATSERGNLIYDNPDDIGNLFCLYGVQSNTVDLNNFSEQLIVIKNDVKKLGEYALLIHFPEEFLKRIENKLKPINKLFNFHPVNYIDFKSYEGELSPFYKSNEYKGQNEIRLWIPNEKEDVFEFFIGDITDISYKMPVSMFNELTIKPE
ncbi:MAG: hypothetical protein KFKLKKLM_02460 [Flavobacteriales bacterium]|nr:hypothetical protein [Flavobacteriales bacterium]